MTEVERGPGYLVKRVQQSLRRRCDSALKPTGLSMAQYSVLRALAAHPEASAAELARLCFVTRQSLQDVLKTLRAEGHVEPSSAPVRGRARSLQLTPRGARLLAGGDSAVNQVESMMLQGMSVATRNRLAELLMQCAENLEAADAATVE
ncbi:MarR family winged helix-turn-helix transcriptional regulator [Mycobacterium sp. HNNTM2301]|uniref:MarR family winged helix-turn-helix transcriptional regulator n=1 Tax=Mycobacterium hainanense TaxID=3289775 RepID=UPI0035A6CD25